LPAPADLDPRRIDGHGGTCVHGHAGCGEHHRVAIGVFDSHRARVVLQRDALTAGGFENQRVVVPIVADAQRDAVARSNQLHVGRRLRRRARLRVPQSADYVCLLHVAVFERDEHFVAHIRYEPGAAIPARHHRRYSRPEIAADDVGRGRHANQHTRQPVRIAIVHNRS